MLRQQKSEGLIGRSRNRGPRLVFWGIELLTGIGLDLLRRYARSWTATLKKEVGTRRQVSRYSSLHGAASETMMALPDTRQESRERSPKKPLYVVSGFELLKNTAGEWSRDKCPQLGAALAYYTVFSLAPLMLVLLALFGIIYGSSDQAREKILDQLRYFIDPSGVKVVQDIANNAARPKAGVLAGIIGILLALFGASGIFGQLQEALNTVWSVKPKPGRGIWGFIRARFLSFAMVGGVCFLLLVSLTVENLLKGLHRFLQAMLPGGHYLGMTLFYVFDLAIIVMLFAMLFRYLPDAKIAWRDVWIGAALTAILFLIGKLLLDLYLSSGAAGSAYGAASSLVTLLLWVLYSAQILLFGAEFTKIYANRYGSHVQPEEHAVKVERREIELPRRREPERARTG
jgi:membrane protein